MKKLTIFQTSDHPTLTFAAEELKRLLALADPALDLTISDAPCGAETAGVLRVGYGAALGVGESDGDEIAIEVKEGGGTVAGSNPRAALIAVYRFLYEAGFRFIRPGREGEIIPATELSSLSVSVREKASYPHRGVCIEGAVSYENVLDMIDFLPKVGMNEYFIQFAVPTEFFARWYEHRGSPVLKPEWGGGDDPRALASALTVSLEGEIKKRSLRYHKVGHGWTCEPFGVAGGGWDARKTPLTDRQRAALAEVNGKRELWGGVPLDTNLCYSDPAVRERVTDAITAFAAENPQVDVIHFWLADGYNNQCECPACRVKRPADWYVMMLNELDGKLTAAGLETKIVFLIYVDLLWEPETERIANPDRFILMFAPITRNYGQNYGDFLEYRGELSPYVRNRLTMPRSLDENIERLRRWQAGFDGDSFDFDYHLMWAHVGDVGYEKCARNLFEDMKDLRKIGLSGMVSCQIQRCFQPTALPFIAMARALWDREADFEETANDWYAAAYGEAGPRVREAMKTLSASCRLYENGSPALDRDEAERGLAMLREAASLPPDAVLRDTAAAASFRYLREYCDYIELLIPVIAAIGKKDKPAAKEAARKLYGRMWQSEPALQPVLDVHNSVGTIRRWIERME